jgi:hypothetical protein
LRLTGDILSTQGERQSLALYGGAMSKAGIGYALKQLFRER